MRSIGHCHTLILVLALLVVIGWHYCLRLVIGHYVINIVIVGCHYHVNVINNTVNNTGHYATH